MNPTLKATDTSDGRSNSAGCCLRSASWGAATVTFFIALLIPLTSCQDSRQVAPERESEPTSLSASPNEDWEIGVVYFYSPGCPDCSLVDTDVIPLLEAQGMEIQKLNVDTPENLRRILEVEKHFGVKFEVLAPNMVYFGRVLEGLENIRREILQET